AGVAIGAWPTGTLPSLDFRNVRLIVLGCVAGSLFLNLSPRLSWGLTETYCNERLPLEKSPAIPTGRVRPISLPAVQEAVLRGRGSYPDAIEFTSCWEADHIQAVAEGGGQCGLENYRTLCFICHKKKSAGQASARARRRSG